MKVTKIDILGLRYDTETNRHEAHLTLTLSGPDNASMMAQFLCHCGQDAEAPSDAVTDALIADALRQAHRMPGFRRGEQRIELALTESATAPLAASA